MHLHWMDVVAVILSLVASLLFAVAAVLQQQGTEGVSDENAMGLGFFATLMKRKVWVAGISADIAGFIFQAAALAVGSLLLVQPLLVSSLLFALPLAAFVNKRKLKPAEWAWAALLIASLVVFLVLGEPSSGIQQPALRSWIFPIAFLVVVVTVCILGARRMPHGSLRSLVLAIAAGLLLGYTAPFTKTGIDAFSEGYKNGHGFFSGLGDAFVGGLSSWEFWAMAITATLGTLWQQSSYQAGDVQTSLPTVTVMKPMVAMALGLTIYEEHLRVEKAGDVAVVVSLIVMWLATFALGRLGAPAPENGGAVASSPPKPAHKKAITPEEHLAEAKAAKEKAERRAARKAAAYEEAVREASEPDPGNV